MRTITWPSSVLENLHISVICCQLQLNCCQLTTLVICSTNNETCIYLPRHSVVLDRQLKIRGEIEHPSPPSLITSLWLSDATELVIFRK